MIYDIRNFGAVADGMTMNTSAINSAVQACARNGGGQVLIPAGGVYLSGTIWLQSHVELHLEHGAVLKGSSDLRDYCPDDAYPENFGDKGEAWTGGHLIVAHRCEDIAITGSGTIDGSAGAYITRKDVGRNPGNPYAWSEGYLRAMRPGQTIAIIKSRNIHVSDITMRDIPAWALFLHGCEQAQIRGVSVLDDPAMTNTDGIDIDSCRYVTVSDCLIDTGDDAIAIRNDTRRLKVEDQVCEYITITNCVLYSCSSVFRLGVGKGDLKHIRVSNLTVRHGHILINFCTEWAGRHRTPLYDVNFSDISATEIGNPVVINTASGVEVQNISLSNIRCEARAGLMLKSAVPGALKNITLRNFDIFLQDDEAYKPDWRRYRGDYVLEAQNIEGLKLDRVRVFASEKELSKWDGKFNAEECPDMLMEDCKL